MNDNNRPGEEVSPANVVRAFLRLEATKDKNAARREELLAWCRGSDDLLLTNAKSYADARKDTNPTLLYTVGVGDENRSHRIRCWRWEQVASADVYSNGINEQINEVLESLNWNLRKFADDERSKQFREFDKREPIDSSSQFIIALSRQKTGREGYYELIDGAHRFVVLRRDGIDQIRALVGCYQ